MCVLSIKVPIRKKSGNLLCVSIYIYIYIYIYISVGGSLAISCKQVEGLAQITIKNK